MLFFTIQFGRLQNNFYKSYFHNTSFANKLFQAICSWLRLSWLTLVRASQKASHFYRRGIASEPADLPVSTKTGAGYESKGNKNASPSYPWMRKWLTVKNSKVLKISNKKNEKSSKRELKYLNNFFSHRNEWKIPMPWFVPHSS